jgi:biotin carboxyl carrier protein
MENNDFQTLNIDDTHYNTKITKKYLSRKPYKPREKHIIRAFIPGTIREIYVNEGDYVKEGDKLLILEAMKMRNTVSAHLSGKIKILHVNSGQNVAKEVPLVTFEI